MRVKASLLATASFATLVVVALGAIRPTFEHPLSANPVPHPITSAGSPSQKSTISPTASDRSDSNKPPLKQSAQLDEPIHNPLNQRFSISNALSRVQQIDRALTSFRQLTGKSQVLSDRQIVSEVRHIDPETQSTGFSNWTGAVSGTLRKQEYQIKRLEFELAQKQYRDGEITRTTLERKQSEYRKASHEFKTFLNSFK